jgi:hypothetical protein
MLPRQILADSHVEKDVATQYILLDGVIEDPVGMEGSGLGNWTGPFKRGAAGDTAPLTEIIDL